MNKSYALAVIDLDDTLLGPDKKISDANRNAVQKLKEAGLQVVLASGRQHEGIMRFHAQLELDTPVVSCQGALVCDPITKKVIFHKPLSNDLADLLLDEAARLKLTVFYFHEQGVFTNASAELKAIYEQEVMHDLETLKNKLLKDPFKILWADVLKDPAIKASLSHHLTKNLYIVETDGANLEFLSPETNKGVGVQELAKFLGIKKEAVICFGDGDNDREMLEWAGLGVAMHHGTKAAKSASNLISSEGEPHTSFARAVQMVFEQY